MKRRLAGSTPDAGEGRPSIVRERPIIFGSPPKRRCHRPWVNITAITALLPLLDSEIYALSRASHNNGEELAETRALEYLSGFPNPVTVEYQKRKAARSSKTRFWFQSRKLAVKLSIAPLLHFDWSPAGIITIRSGSSYDEVASKWHSPLKIVVFAPIPSARINVVVIAKPGCLMRVRLLERRSCNGAHCFLVSFRP